MKHWYQARQYDTRFDRFRVRHGISLSEWRKEARVSRTQMQRYRAGTAEPYSTKLADLVRAARKLAGAPVFASDLADLGEDEPLGERSPQAARRSVVRKSFGTPFDQLLRREGVVLEKLAEDAQTSRQQLLHLRTGRRSKHVDLFVIRNLVRALRRAGIDVRAQDITDVGDDAANPQASG